jgi:hypothetical protein
LQAKSDRISNNLRSLFNTKNRIHPRYCEDATPSLEALEKFATLLNHSEETHNQTQKIDDKGANYRVAICRQSLGAKFLWNLLCQAKPFP